MNNKNLRNTDPLQIVLDNTMAKVYVCDVDTYEILFANKRLKSDYPYEIEGRKCWEALSSFDGPCPYCKLHEVMKRPLGEPYQWENYNPDYKMWLQMNDSIAKWTDGRNVHLITFADVTEIKNNEAKVIEYKDKLEALLAEKTESEERLKAMTDNMPHSFSFQLQRNPGEIPRLLYASKGIETILGVNMQEVGQDITKLWAQVHPEDLENMETAAKANKPFKQEVRFTRPDTGELVWLDFAEIPRNNNRTAYIWDGLALNITARKKIEAELKLSQTELLLKAQQINDITNNIINSAIYRTHVEDGHIILDYASGNLEQMLGHSIEELKKDFSLFLAYIHPADKAATIPRIVGTTQNLEPAVSEFRFLAGDKVLWLKMQSKGFVRDGVVYRDGIVYDTTEQKNLEAELIAARNKAEESDKLKSTFMANMSHEIRTPMNAIVGFLDLVCQEGEDAIDSDTKKEFMEIVTKNANQLLKLIGDLLDISKIDAGQMKVTPEAGNLNELMKYIYFSFAASKAMNNKTIDFVYDESGEDAQGLFILDYTRIRQILDNLIGNAIKFTENGYVKFGYNVVPDGVRFTVEDTGIGIAKEKLNDLGKPFNQLHDASLAAKYGGTGIGVAISKNLVQLMGGTFHVTSELNRGTRFVLTIPCEKVHE